MNNPSNPNSSARRPPRRPLSMGGLIIAALVLLVIWWRGNAPLPLVKPPSESAQNVGVTLDPPTTALTVTTASVTPSPATPADVARVEEPATAASTAVEPPTITPTTPQPTPTSRAVRGRSGLPTIPYDELPPEGQETVALIEQGGPFPFDKDDSVFQNREGILPQERRGYYREYTVITPGEGDRGARRIVAGAGGELYYTDDHYNSFREIVR